MAKKESVTDRVVNYIREEIESGRWALGSRIPSENELCEILGCSRVSVRAAIQKYVGLGVLRSERGRGTFVSSGRVMPSDDGALVPAGRSGLGLNDEQMFALYLEWRQARSLIEPEIAYHVAQTADDALIRKLSDLTQEMRDLVGDQDRFIQKDVRFHLTLAEAYGNSFVLSAMRLLLEQRDLLYYGNDRFGFFGGVYFHALITDAIARHDPDSAKRLMIDHCYESAEIRRLLGNLGTTGTK